MFKSRINFKRFAKIIFLTILFLILSLIFAGAAFFAIIEWPDNKILHSIGEKVMVNYLSEDDFFIEFLADNIKKRMSGWENNKYDISDEFKWAKEKIEQAPDDYKIPQEVSQEKIDYFSSKNNNSVYSLKQIYQMYKNSVAAILLRSESAEFSLGSGFLVSEDGIMATNYHVVFDESDDYQRKNQILNMAVVFSEDKTIYSVKAILALDKCHDLAIIKIDTRDKKLKSIPLGDSDKIEIGDKIATLGSPRFYANSFFDGLVNGARIYKDCPYELIQISVPSDSGNSGGPIFNEHGEAVAIYKSSANDIFHSPIRAINFAVPVNFLRELIGQK